MKKLIICFSLIIFAFVVFFFVFLSKQSRLLVAPPVKVLQLLQDAGLAVLNQPAEPNDFTISSLDGRDISFSDYNGNVIILTFWATWCSSCQEEMPSKELLYQRFNNQGLEILAVNLEEEADTVRQFIHNYGYTFPVLLDHYGEVKAGYEVDGYPTNYILNREGKIIAMHTGRLDWNTPEIANAFELLLKVSDVASAITQRLTDAERFALEYPLVGSDNIFVYKNASQTADILANGTGVVFMGFKECPWCQLYAVFLHDIAREIGLARIFYCDIREDRQNNSDSYQRIVTILSDFLQYDDEGRPKVYVPDVTIVNGGKVIGRDFETSKETLGYGTPQEYWNDDRLNAFKERLREGIKKGILRETNSSSGACNEC